MKVGMYEGTLYHFMQTTIMIEELSLQVVCFTCQLAYVHVPHPVITLIPCDINP